MNGSYFGDEPFEYRTLSSGFRMARKEYTCVFCLKPIPRNTSYWRTTYIFEGEFHCDHTHSATIMCTNWDQDNGK